jgi:3',5'-cyclic AMP phosphodiesterase CpdA
MRKLLLIVVIAAGVGPWALARQEVTLTGMPDALKFAVIGDTGSGQPPQFDVGRQMAAARTRFPFELVLMLGDNMYGSQRPQDFVDKFERPYAALLQAGVPFYAALGNHDNQSNRSYKGFNMGGERYYTFVKKSVRFFVLDTNLMDAKQLDWIEAVLEQSREEWQVAYFHHPLYSDAGRHGSNVELRVVLEPLFVRHGVDVVFAGHEHVYQRSTPQKGITHFIEGSSGQLRKGDMRPTAMTAAFFDQDQTFMLVQIDGDEMQFQTISRTGRVVDSGVIHRRPTT